MKKFLLFVFLLSFSFLSFSQTASETHNFITYDTSYNIGYAYLGYQLRITRPKDLFTPGSPDTASRPVIIHMSGVGEIGTDPNVTATYGPHYWLANGWDGGITLGNGKHYPIIITVQSWTAWPGTTELLTLINYLLAHYHIKRNSVHLTGLSMGAFSWTALICHQTTPGAEDGMKNITSIAALEGQSTLVSPAVTANELPGFQSFAVWAQKYHGKFFGLEGINDYRNVAAVSEAMNGAVPGVAYFSYETIGGGTHCCWNSMYDPSVTNWTSVGTLGPNNANQASPNTMGTYKAPCNIFTWMLRQGDTSLVGATTTTTVTSNAGSNQTLAAGANSATLNGGLSLGSLLSYSWTQVSGPNTATIASPSSVTTAITGLISGTYVFALKVSTVLGLSSTSQVSIVVPAVNIPPVAVAGSDISVTLPVNTATLSGSGTDKDGTVASYAWKEVSGPNTATIATPTSAKTTVSGLIAGTYVFSLTVTDNQGATGSDNVNIVVNAASTSSVPPVTTYVAVPATIQAESYVNESGVATETTTDAGGGLDVGWIDTKDWMTYNISVATAGTYNFSFRVAVPYRGAALQVKNAAGAVLQTLSLTQNGGWQTWETITTSVVLPAGNQTITIVSSGSGNWNFNWMQISAASSGSVSSGASSSSSSSITSPTGAENIGVGGSTPTLVPGKVAASKYYEVSGTISQATTDVGGGNNLAWIDNGNWMAYKWNVPTSGTYRVNFRLATVNNGGVLQLRTPTGTVLMTVSVPNTGGWQTWQTVGGTVNLPAGVQTLVVWNSANPEWNFNWMEIVYNTTAAAVVTNSAVAGQSAGLGVITDASTTLFTASTALFPNPATDHATLSLNNAHTGQMNVDVIDVLGRIVRRFQYSKDQQTMQVTLPISDLQKGNYFIRVRIGDWMETQKLLKQ